MAFIDRLLQEPPLWLGNQRRSIHPSGSETIIQ